VSVINKVLRDLDHRQAAALTGAATASGGDATARGVSPVGAMDRSARLSRLQVWLVVLAGMTALGVLAWFGMGEMDLRTGSAPQVALSVAVPPAPAPSGSTPAQPADVVAPVAVASHAVASQPVSPPSAAQGEMVLRMEESISARKALDALLSTPVPTAAAPSTAATLSTRVKPREPAVASAPVVSAIAKPSAPASAKSTVLAAPAEAPVAVPRQPLTGGDVLAQVQSLWNLGSHDAAFDLMQQSIANAERAAKSGSSQGSGAVLAPLVREMARMQLSDGRYGAVWDMLTRLESVLGNHPDLWAIRANAAQRLGRHQDSVHAYMVALQSRPDQQRWLLGAAVSLAALGQASSAAEMAEKARAVGPVSKDILAYLRQSGVVLRD
jgi:MSHA biogenesis protein MshN